MRNYSPDEIRQCFSSSTDFNEIFDAFQSAMARRLADLELYRVLFWNPSLIPDEVRLFGEKIVGVFPEMSYEVYLWLAGMFEATYSMNDNHELAVEYYRKAALAKPHEAEPLIKLCGIYDPDLAIPPLGELIEFVLRGLPAIENPSSVYQCLGELYQHAGDPQQAEYYRRKAGVGGDPPAGITLQ
jgi:TPR repeat protein